MGFRHTRIVGGPECLTQPSMSVNYAFKKLWDGSKWNRTPYCVGGGTEQAQGSRQRAAPTWPTSSWVLARSRRESRDFEMPWSTAGFTLFWDQEIPATTDWDSSIRQHLNESKCAVVVWSTNSILSDNVRHEALIAKQQNKLVPVSFRFNHG